MDKSNLKRIILSLLVIAVCAFLGCAQRSVQNQGKGGTQIEGTKITAKGKIGYMRALGGHFVMSEEPAGEFIIVNPDPGLLEDLYKRGKTVLIEGHLTIGADRLFIEKIDGKKYQGKE